MNNPAVSQRFNKINYCRVCGMYYESLPWGIDGETPSFDICVCCGVEFGYEDATPFSITQYRKKWINSGAKWFDKKFQPKDWDLNTQLKNVIL